MILPKKIWKNIEGYEGLYHVNNLGQVKSLRKNILLSSSIKKNGYHQVVLQNNGYKKYVSVHRLVAIAFLDNPKNYPQVNHIDENKSNNCVWNLEWCTAEYNTNYGTGMIRQVNKRKGKFILGDNKRARKCKCIETGIVYDCIKSASKATNITEGNISRCCNGQRHTAGGFHWEYIN